MKAPVKSNDGNMRITGDKAMDLALLRLASLLAEIAESQQGLDGENKNGECKDGEKRHISHQ